MPDRIIFRRKEAVESARLRNMEAILTQSIRERNRRLILEIINHQEMISRAEIARESGLNKASVSEIVAELLDENLIEETPAAKSSGGRRPIPLRLTNRRYVALACDINPHEIRLALGYNDGTFALRRSFQTPVKRSNVLTILEEAIAALLVSYKEMFAGQKQEEIPILGAMTLSIYGVVARNEVQFTPYYDLQGLDLVTPLSQRFGVPVYLMNEADLAANGEWATRGPLRDLLSLKIREGIGLGIVLQGEREHGANGFAGEFGHSILVPQGIQCPCGNRGCLEQYLSESALLQAYAEALPKRRANLRDLLRSWEEGDPATLRLMNAYESYLAVSMNNLIRLFDPRYIILNSRVAPHIPDFVERLYAGIQCEIPSKCEIVLSELGDEASLLGGLALAFEHTYDLNHFFFSTPQDETNEKPL